MNLCSECGFEVGGVLCRHKRVMGYDVSSGTGSGPEPGGAGMPKYRWARHGKWSIKYWPEGGGAQGFVDVDGIGTVVDVNDDMPHDVWLALLSAVDGLMCL